MKLWMSGEVHGDIGDEFRRAMNDVEGRVNRILATDEFGDGLQQWAYLAIILPEGFEQYKEVKRHRKAKNEVEFRLRIDYENFKMADSVGKRKLLLESLIRSLILLPELGVTGVEHKKLIERLKGAER